MVKNRRAEKENDGLTVINKEHLPDQKKTKKKQKAQRPEQGRTRPLLISAVYKSNINKYKFELI